MISRFCLTNSGYLQPSAATSVLISSAMHVTLMFELYTNFKRSVSPRDELDTESSAISVLIWSAMNVALIVVLCKQFERSVSPREDWDTEEFCIASAKPAVNCLENTLNKILGRMHACWRKPTCISLRCASFLALTLSATFYPAQRVLVNFSWWQSHVTLWSKRFTGCSLLR